MAILSFIRDWHITLNREQDLTATMHPELALAVADFRPAIDRITGTGLTREIRLVVSAYICSIYLQ